MLNMDLRNAAASNKDEIALNRRKVWISLAVMFIVLCLLEWANELFDLSHLLFNAPQTLFNWRETILETVLILSVGLFTVFKLVRSIAKIEIAESALFDSEEKYRALVEFTKDAIYLVDEQGRYLFANHALVDIIGLQKDQILERTYEELHSTKETAIFMEEIRKVYESFESSRHQYKSSRDGRYFLRTLNPVTARDGKIEAITVVSKDITELELAKEAVENERRWLSTTVQSLGEGVIAVDMEGRIILINPVAESLTGWKRQDAVGRPLKTVLNITEEETGMCYKDFLEKVSKTGRVLRLIDTTLVSRDGKGRDVSVSGASIRGMDGEVFGGVVVVHNIAEEKRIASLRQQRQKKEALGDLAGGIAHDFNNILTIILGNIELATEILPEDNPTRENLNDAHKACQRAKEIINQILSFGRYTHGNLEPVTIVSVVRESLKLLRKLIPTDVEIRQNFSDEINTILANPTQIGQVTMNLCTNAAHAMEEGGGVLEVILKNVEMDQDSARHLDLRPGRYVNLTFRDTGSGIAPNLVERIFEPYFTTKEVGKGTGMGLAVVAGIIEGHKGAINVTSEPQEGTVFDIFFPVAETGPREETQRSKEIPTGDERILLVDDEEHLLAIGSGMLEWLGYQVQTTGRPDEALELIRSNPFDIDLVITDMTMPQMRGDALAKAIMKIRADMPIIICTGFSKHMDEKTAKIMGIKALIKKPFTIGEFARSIRKALDEGKTIENLWTSLENQPDLQTIVSNAAHGSKWQTTNM